MFPVTSATAVKGTITINLTYVAAKDVWEGKLTSVGTWTVAIAGANNRNARTTLDVQAFIPYAVELTLPSLPDGYTKLEYIDSNLNYTTNTIVELDTGLTVDSRSRIAGQFAVTSAVSGQVQMMRPVCGNLALTSMVQCSRYTSNMFIGIDSYYKVNFMNGTSTNIVSTISTRNLGVNTPISFDGRSSTIAVNGSTYTMTSYTAQTAYSSRTMCLWFRHSSTISAVVVRWHNFKMFSSNGTSVVCSLFTCKQNSTGSLGMYDTVRNSFFLLNYSHGLIAGPEVI